jgi:hypothetical protein
MITLLLNKVTRFQLDAVPTGVGYLDSILWYFSALYFIFDGARMLKEGYQKATRLSLLYRTHDAPTFRQDQVYSKSPIFGDGWC